MKQAMAARLQQIPNSYWVGLIFVLGWFLRSFNLHQTMPFTYDQGRDLQVLAELAAGDLKFLGPTTGIAGFFLGPLIYYVLLPGFWLSGGHPVGVGLWSALLVSLVIPAAYLCLKEVVSQRWAILGAGLFAISSGGLIDGRVIWNPSLTAVTLVTSLWLLFASRTNHKLLILSWGVLGLSLQTEIAYAFFLLPVWTIWSVWHSPFKTMISKHAVSHYSWLVLLLAGLAFASTLIPQALFELKNDGLMTRSLIRESQDVSKKVSWEYVLTTRPPLMLQAVSSVTWGDHSLTAIGWLLLICAIVALLLTARFEATTWVLLGYLIFPVAGMMLFRGNQGAFFDYYLRPHYAPILLVLTVGFTKLNRWWLSTCLVVFLIIGAVKPISLVFDPSPLQYTISQEQAALKWVYQRDQQPVGLDIFVPNLLPTQYQYLHAWFAQHDTYPSQPITIRESDNPYYLLIEPPIDTGSQFAFDEWYARSTTQANCEPVTKFGLIVIEECVKNPK